MNERLVKSWRMGFKQGAKHKVFPKAERSFRKNWKDVPHLNTFEAQLLGEVDGLHFRLDGIEVLAGI